MWKNYTHIIIKKKVGLNRLFFFGQTFSQILKSADIKQTKNNKKTNL